MKNTEKGNYVIPGTTGCHPIKMKVSFNGRIGTLDEWAEEVGVSPVTLRKRIKIHGIEHALTTPKGEPATLGEQNEAMDRFLYGRALV